MRRLVVGFVLVAAIAVATAWVADHPGRVTLLWGGWRIETSAGLLGLAMALLMALAAAAYSMWRWLKKAPARLGGARGEGRRARGYQALTQGLVAVAGGDAKEARRLARQAEKLLDSPPLTKLLQAQAAQLANDEAAAERYFRAMLEEPETEFLGVRGLLVQASRRGDKAEAMTWAKRAIELKPDTAWALMALFDLQSAAGQWPQAEATLKSAARIGVYDRTDEARRQAIVHFAQARTAETEGRPKQALGHAKRAHDLAPDFVPATVLYGRLLAATGKLKRATALIIERWRRAPHPDLAAAFLEFVPDEAPLDRLKRLAPLAAANREHRETRILLAEAALAADELARAREYLIAAGAEEDAPGPRVAQLMAELEEKQHGDAGAAREWLMRAAKAPPEPRWVCGACGQSAEDWSTHCPACGAFDQLRWAPAGEGAKDVALPLHRTTDTEQTIRPEDAARAVH